MSEAGARELEPNTHTHRIVPVRPGERLEFAVTYGEPTRASGALLCSPQPFLGGDLDNNVVRAIANRLATGGRPVLRFNYRAVGKSLDVTAGRSRYDYWKAVEEQQEFAPVLEDCASALLRSRALFDVGIVGGYSFGAFAAMRLCMDARIAPPLVLVAPPLAKLDFSPLEGLGSGFRRILMIFAEKDALDPTPPLSELEARFPRATIHVLRDADHFFRGDESSVGSIVAEFAASSCEVAP